ncbi:MAG: hypothetical protein WBP72_07095 [Rhodocyclaceae bacterium]
MPTEEQTESKRSMRPRLSDLFVVLGVAGIALIVWIMKPKGDILLPPSTCNLSEHTCSVEMPGGGRMDLTMDPRPIPTTQPFRIQLDGVPAEVDSVSVDFAGAAMNMGYNRPKLELVAPGRFEGQASLPICVTGRMEWRATLLLQVGKTQIGIPFQFSAG